MNEKVIVKVMNFHSLIRVDAARRKAEKYGKLETEVSDLIDMIVNNRNFILDKSVLHFDDTKPELNIYIGSDYGFCGSINSAINKVLEQDETANKIIIGKKLRTKHKGVLLKIAREEFISHYEQIEKILYDSLWNASHSKINVIYNHFHNTSNIEFKQTCIYPLDVKKKESDQYKEDYYVEGDANQILMNLLSSYLSYEVKIAEVNSYASENIIRQNATTESLKKIEERDELRKVEERKEKTRLEFAKVIDSYTKMKGYRGE